MSAAVDSKGRALTKDCPGCHATLGRTMVQCKCGHRFWRHGKVGDASIPPKPRRLPAKQKGPIMAVSPEVAADAERQLLAIASSVPPVIKPTESRHDEPVALDPRFYCQVTSSGGLIICWPGFDIRFTLPRDEASTVRKALT